MRKPFHPQMNKPQKYTVTKRCQTAKKVTTNRQHTRIHLNTQLSHTKKTQLINNLTHTHIKLDLGDKEEYLFDTKSERVYLYNQENDMLTC